jgi:Ca2+-transporting ATPase
MLVGTAGSTNPWHALSIEQSLARGGSREHGLSSEEAKARVAKYGPNALDAKSSTPWFRVLLDQLESVFVALLVFATALALLLGDTADGVGVLAVLLITVAFGFVTELRARRAVDALRALQVQKATVVRDGLTMDIDARELVPGDIIQLEAGASVPADGRLIQASRLQVREAELTGESIAVDKNALVVLAPGDALPDRANMVYLGTSVVAGAGEAMVTATGMRTEVGHIGSLVSAVPFARTLMEKRLDTLGRQLAFVAVLVGVVVAAMALMRGIDLETVIRTGMAVAIAAVPEGLPAVVTIAMAIGVHRMARRHAIVRRLPTIENIGSITIVCSDKTGTLTRGDMSVTQLVLGGTRIRVGGSDGMLAADSGDPVEARTNPAIASALRIAALANRADVRRVGDGWEERGDPTEIALLSLALQGGVDRDALLEQWPELAELPFSSERMLMATYHRSPDGLLMAQVKGAPGPVAALCETLSPGERSRLLSDNESLAAEGLRVLALAEGAVDSTDEEDLRGLTFVGLVAMIDSPGDGVRETIRQLADAGIRTVMLTGDQRKTAEAVAVSLGIMQQGEAETLEGREVDAMSDEALADRVQRVGAFSRVSPEAKLRIVGALQRRGEIVAMLGDGVNDAPALRKADVGVAMGKRGTDAAREAADVVLSDDRFATIGSAVEEGRVIFDNVQKFTFYLFSCNLAEILVLLGAGLFGFPLPLLPLQILWLNLVTDTFPAFVLAFEPADPDVMRRVPRDPRSHVLSRDVMARILFYSALIAACALGAFHFGLREHPGDVTYAITMTFMTLAFAQLFHLGNARSRGAVVSPRRAMANPLAVGAVLLVVFLQLVAMYVKPVAQLLDLVPLSRESWLIVAGLGVLPGVVGQTLKLLRGRAATIAAAVIAMTPAAALSQVPSVPAAGTMSINLNVPASRLDVRRNGIVFRSFPVSPGTKKYRTPIGDFQLTEMTWNPWWHPPKSWWARKEKITPPGPENPMGKVKMMIGSLLYLHATPSVTQIGHPASHGCVRMLPDDAVELARMVLRETRAQISEGAVDDLVTRWDETRTVGLPEPISVKITYDLLELRGDSILVHPDIYGIRSRPTASAVLDILSRSGIDTANIDRGKLDQLLRRGRSASVGEKVSSLGVSK